MAKGYQEVDIFCTVSQTQSKILVPKGIVEQGGNGYLRKPCIGCTRWNTKEIEAADEFAEVEYGQSVDNNRKFKLSQTLSHQNLDEAADIVVNMCSPF